MISNHLHTKLLKSCALEVRQCKAAVHFHSWILVPLEGRPSSPTRLPVPCGSHVVGEEERIHDRRLNSPNDFAALLECFAMLTLDQQQLVCSMLGTLAADRADSEIAQTSWQTAKSRLTVA